MLENNQLVVYVDDMKAKYEPAHRPGVVYVLSHMISDDENELHAMAQKIGVARRWFRDDHYDITQTCKALALALGAVQITWRQAACMMTNVRQGCPMGTPKTAQDIAHKRRSARKKS